MAGRRRRSRGVILAFVLCTLVACGGGGGGAADPDPLPPITLVSLTGTWFGTLWNFNTFGERTIQMTVSSVGNITGLEIDGVPTAGTGTATHVVGQRFVLDLGSLGDVTMSVDEVAVHATGVTTEDEMLVIQKGATSLDPPYLASHLRDHTWGGHAFGVDAALAVDATAQGVMTVLGDGAFSGSVGGSSFVSTAPLSGPVSDSGFSVGSYELAGVEPGQLWLRLTPDKLCLCGFAIPSVGLAQWPEDATFLVWPRQ